MSRGTLTVGNEAPFQPGQVVISKAGRDKGRLYVVLKVESDRYIQVADGSARTVRRPKRKNVRHVQPHGPASPEISQRLAEGRPVDDQLVRQALAEAGGGAGHDDPDEAIVERG